MPFLHTSNKAPFSFAVALGLISVLLRTDGVFASLGNKQASCISFRFQGCTEVATYAQLTGAEAASGDFATLSNAGGSTTEVVHYNGKDKQCYGALLTANDKNVSSAIGSCASVLGGLNNYVCPVGITCPPTGVAEPPAENNGCYKLQPVKTCNAQSAAGSTSVACFDGYWNDLGDMDTSAVFFNPLGPPGGTCTPGTYTHGTDACQRQFVFSGTNAGPICALVNNAGNGNYLCRANATCPPSTRTRNRRALLAVQIDDATYYTSTTTSTTTTTTDDPPAQQQQQQQDPYIQDVVDRCGSFEYETFLFVDSHIYGVGVPGPEAVAAGCPFVITHAMADPEASAAATTTNRKEIILVGKNNQRFQHLLPPSAHQKGSDSKIKMDNDNESSFASIGTFKLEELAKAVDRAWAGGSQGGGIAINDRSATTAMMKANDIIANNCGIYMISLASELGIQIDSRLTSFVARRLLEAQGKALVDSIRSSMSFSSLFSSSSVVGDNTNDYEEGRPGIRSRHLVDSFAGGEADWTDAQIVQRLVELHATTYRHGGKE